MFAINRNQIFEIEKEYSSRDGSFQRYVFKGRRKGIRIANNNIFASLQTAEKELSRRLGNYNDYKKFQYVYEISGDWIMPWTIVAKLKGNCKGLVEVVSGHISPNDLNRCFRIKYVKSASKLHCTLTAKQKLQLHKQEEKLTRESRLAQEALDSFKNDDK